VYIHQRCIYGVYIPICIFVVLCAIPIIILTIFECMTYCYIQQTMVLDRHNANRQLTKRICIQVIVIIVSQTSYSIYNTYILFTIRSIKNTDRLNKEYFAYTFTTLVYYIYYAVSQFLIRLFIGNVLCISCSIKSFSSNSEGSNILLAKTKSYCSHYRTVM
jgi:hypothetical protein